MPFIVFTALKLFMNRYAVYYPGPCSHQTHVFRARVGTSKRFSSVVNGLYRLLKNKGIKALFWVPVRALVYLSSTGERRCPGPREHVMSGRRTCRGKIIIVTSF